MNDQLYMLPAEPKDNPRAKAAAPSEPAGLFEITDGFYDEFGKIGNLFNAQNVEKAFYKSAQKFYADQYFHELGLLTDIKNMELKREHFTARTAEQLKLKVAKRLAKRRKRQEKKQYQALRADERRGAAEERKLYRLELKEKIRLMIRLFFSNILLRIKKATQAAKLKRKLKTQNRAKQAAKKKTSKKGAKPPKEVTIHDD